MAVPATLLPANLVAAVEARLGRLSGPAQTLVHLVAVWGQPLAVRDAAALLDRGSAADLSGWITEGVHADLLVGQGQRITIRHDLIREAVDAGMPGAVRVALHRQCAEYLLASGRGALAAAPHMRESASVGDERAVTVLSDAATESLASLPETAARLMGQAFELVPFGHPRWLPVGERYADILSQVQHGDDVVAVVDKLLTGVTDAESSARLQVIAARGLWLAGAPAQIVTRVAVWPTPCWPTGGWPTGGWPTGGWPRRGFRLCCGRGSLGTGPWPIAVWALPPRQAGPPVRYWMKPGGWVTPLPSGWRCRPWVRWPATSCGTRRR